MQGAKRALSHRPLLTGGTLFGLMALILMLGAALLSSQALHAAQPSARNESAAPANIVTNGDFETGTTTGWANQGGGTIAITTTLVHSGNFAAAVTTNATMSASSGAAGGGNCAGGLRIPISANTSYTWSGWVNVPVGTNLASARIRVAWYAVCSGGSQISTVDTNLVTTATGTWVQVTGTATSPATAAFAELRLFGAPSTAASITLYFDDVTMDPTVAGTPTNTATAAPTNTPGGPTNTPTLSPTPLPPGPRIHDIQGASHISTYSNTLVSNVPGIVTALRTNGFYLQDPTPDANDATSEAIFVFTSSAPTVSVGNSVLVSGRINEFRAGGAGGITNLTQTEIVQPTVSLISGANPLPSPVVIGTGGRVPPIVVIDDDATGDVETSGTFDAATDGIDFYESMESMRVQVNNPVATGPSNSFGEISVLADNGGNGAGVRTTRGGIIIQQTDFNPERIILAGDIGVNTPVVNVGDHFSGPAVGIMDYTFGNFKLQITQALAAVSSGLAQEVTTPAAANQIAIGNFNVENLAPTDPITKFNTLANLIVNNVKSPDIISVEEIQDNSGAVDNGIVAADLTWNALIAAISNAGGPTYEYRQINPVNNQDGGQPGGNIRQGFLFRTDRGVTFVDRPGGGPITATMVLPGPQGPILSSSPGRIDPLNTAFNTSRKPLAGEFLINGQRLFVIGNHFNSKGGDDSLFSHFQPPIRSSETQRHNQAQVVNDFVDQILALDTNANVVVLGDLNDFNFSDTLVTLKGSPSVLNDLILSLPLPERYTYVFDGNSQDLDHILVSNHISATVPLVFDVIHVNSEFANQASDHEPQAVRLAFPAQGTPTVTTTPNTSATTTPTGTVTATRTATVAVTGTTSPTNTRTSTATPNLTPTPGTSTPTRTPTVIATATATATPGCTSGWSVIPSPSVGQYESILNGVAVLAANNVWAVGYSGVYGASQLLILHWDGSAWTVVPGVNPGTSDNVFQAITAVAPNDIWAVGWSQSGPGASDKLIEHWNGSQWSVVSNIGDGGLVSVAASASNDVWAVGYSTAASTLTMHWNGSTWNSVPVPSVPGNPALLSVSVHAANDAWAVGHYYLGSVSQTLVMHWNGTSWSMVASPSLGPYSNDLRGVTAISTNDVWAVGYWINGPVIQTLILHWDGTQWAAVNSPSPVSSTSSLQAVTALAANDVWAVGSYTSASEQVLTEHWDGVSWSIVTAPNGGADFNRFRAVAAGANTVWTAGHYAPSSPNWVTLVERYSGPCPTPTGTPATATVTPIPTTCPVQFQDVPNGSTFYEFIRCLACRGIVGGYPCGGPGEPCPGSFFRPNNNVTRGQVSKIVSESAGFGNVIPSTQWTFQDVPPSGTFWLWVERLSGRGIIGGYPCGGALEPCVAPGNRPYFRPNNDVTRGQLSKIVSGAAGWTETPTGQTFQDVAVGSTFYVYVERVASRGIVSGYPCGGVGEPCITPGNKPYFRPNNNATRGQMAKIAASAFFPGCSTPARQ